MRDFNHSINVLVEAYRNNTLKHDYCAACAIGNLVAEATGDTVIANCGLCFWDKGYPDWYHVFITFNDNQTLRPEEYKGHAKRQIDATGYTWQELAKIEYAFETAPQGESDDDWMFNGLMAVVDVLADIHGIDLDTVRKTKTLFESASINGHTC